MFPINIYLFQNPVNESKNQINDSLYTEEKLKTEIDVENHGTDTPNFDQITKSPTSNILLTKVIKLFLSLILSNLKFYSYISR